MASIRAIIHTVAVTLAMLAAPVAAKQTDSVRRIDAGPIWNQMDAARKCPAAAAKAGGTWTGAWRTTVPGQRSECDVSMAKARGPSPASSSGPKVERLKSGKWIVEAGPLHADAEAKMKCPRIVAGVGGQWTGQWWTTSLGRMSVCEFTK